MSDAASVPAKLVAGDTFVFDFPETWRAYLPPQWALDFVLRLEAGGAPVTVTAMDTGSLYRVKFDAATTAALTPGAYVWAALVRDDATGERWRVEAGRVAIDPDPLTATGDARSAAARILAAIDATLEGRASKDADSYSIEGRSISRTPVADLLRLRSFYQAQLAAEAGGGGIVRRRVGF